MKVKIVCVGNLKEDYLKNAVAEYEKRLKKFCKLEIIELKQGKSDNENAKKEEYADIAKHLEGYVVTMAIEGKQQSSEDFAKHLNEVGVQGNSTITFVIGGSFGVDERIKQQSQILFSFSKMTFPHQLFRVMLLEQLYRAFNIQANTPYHK